MVFLGNYFLLEMLVFTVESKADFFHNPWEGMREDSGWRGGAENILLSWCQNLFALARGQRNDIYIVLSWSVLCFTENLLLQEE